LANVLAALECGVRAFEGSVGGMGGCPFAPERRETCPPKTWSVCLEEMGIDTGVDLVALIACAHLAERIVGHDLPGQIMKAGRVCDLHPAPGALCT